MRRRRWIREDRRATSGALSLAVVLAASTADAQRAPINAGALFLEFPVGARAVGMGQATLADGGRGEAAFWNPAGLASLAQSAFELHTALLFAGRTSAVAAYFPSARIGVLGGAVYLVDYGDQPVTDDNGNVLGRIALRNYEFLASYATTLPGPFALGLNYKMVGFQADCAGACTGAPNGQGASHALDLGGQFTLDGPGVTVGIALRNLGFKLQVENADQADELPGSLGVGALWVTPLGPVGDSTGSRIDLRLAADVDNPWGETGSTEVRVGVDVGYREIARVRAGYGWQQSGTGGASVGLGVAAGSVGVDLAQTFLSGSDLDQTGSTFFSFRVAF